LKKTIPLLIISIMIIGSFQAVALSKVKNFETIEILDDIIKLSDFNIEKTNDYVKINIADSNSNLLVPGKPVIPVITKCYTFPFGTIIDDISVKIDLKDHLLNGKIQPSPQIQITSNLDIKRPNNLVYDTSIYNSNNLYPEHSYSIRTGVGLDDDQHVLFINIHVYPQYSPLNNIISIPEKIDISIKYVEPKQDILNTNTYDMLIITHDKFASALQPLVNHKNSIGVSTILETVDDIYPIYAGRDDAEDIKLRIKDAIEDWGIKYVLLAGGRKGQTYDWYVPDRRTNLDDGSGYERGYSSDLYFSDIYKYENGNYVFDDWDSNGNGVFAEYSTYGINKDYIDYYPDVYIGRIPIRYSWEVDVILDKIITYENSASDSWFKQAVVVSGDTSPPARDESGIIVEGVYEGEISTGITAEMLEDIGFSVQRLFTSDGSWSSKYDVIDAISAGSGFIHFAGHGNPSSWVNFLPDAQTEEDKVDGFDLFDMRLYSNNEKLPVIVVGGCHNAQFNVTMQVLIEGLMNYGAEFFAYDFYLYEWVPTETCSWFLLEEGGGSIASIGNSGLGYGYINEFCTQGLGGWLNPRFFQAYAIQGKQILGEAHSQAITDYITFIFFELPGQEDVDRKSIEEWILLGDPSLKLGGI
jgi:hypothetical protein